MLIFNKYKLDIRKNTKYTNIENFIRFFSLPMFIHHLTLKYPKEKHIWV